MIPLKPSDIQAVLNKRKGRVKIDCVLCDRRIGWYSPETIVKIIERVGVTMCDDCRKQTIQMGVTPCK